MKKNTKVIEGWLGPGRRDPEILPLPLSEDGLHSDLNKRGQFEWWYFDAHLDSGHTLVVFFHAANPNPGFMGKSGVEIVLLRPDGNRVQKFIPYPRQQFSAARDKPEVTIGPNTLRVDLQHDTLPTYQITISEQEFECSLSYKAQVNGWKPGTGLSHFGDLGSFGWVVPFARAAVEGTITDGGKTLQVSGIGYHDHNWLDFPFQSIINYWMWGRIYSERYTVSYAYIQCNQKVDNHAVKVLMLAEGQEVILSTGEFDFQQNDFAYDSSANHHFPRQIEIIAPGELEASLKMNRVLEAQDMLENFNPILRFLAKNFLRLRPGYFRLLSDFVLDVTRGDKTVTETGTTLHEIVIFKPVQED
jgi:hypothetical protein